MDHPDDHRILVLSQATGGVTQVAPPRDSTKPQVIDVKLRAAKAGQRGMVTAEIALACLGAVAVLVILSGLVYLGVLQLRLGDAVAETARQAARGDSVAVARAQEGAPEGTTFTIREHQGEVHVRAEYQHPTPVGEVPLSAEAWVLVE